MEAGEPSKQSRESHVSHAEHAQLDVRARRKKPLELLAEQDKQRIIELVPWRYGRMLESPFAFYRGAAVVMAQDLANAPSTSIDVQICGDAHIMNFGTFATPERAQVFDVNDFDETTQAPWDWDVKRLAASVVLAARQVGFGEHVAREATYDCVTSYQEEMHESAELGYLQLHYARVRADELLPTLHGEEKKAAERYFLKAHLHDALQALEKVAVVEGDEARIRDNPPLVMHTLDGAHARDLLNFVHDYRRSLAPNMARLLDRFELRDIARKVVGVGSVGTRCYVVLLTGRDLHDPLFLQVKQAFPSVIERYVHGPKFADPGERVVRGQHIMQAASDIFLGFGKLGKHYYYVRQLRDMKGSVDAKKVNKEKLKDYVAMCGRVLAMGHARSGNAREIAKYLGHNDKFALAVTHFAELYADQTELDHASLENAVRAGHLRVEHT